jgi:hypothetical protein
MYEAGSQGAAFARQAFAAMLRQQVDQRSAQVGERMLRMAAALQEAARLLEDEAAREPAGAALRALAAWLDGAAGYVTTANCDRMLADLNAFGRKRPVIMGLAAFAAGFTGARILRTAFPRGSAHGTDAIHA